MSQFNYKARTPEGEIRIGVVEAISEGAAADLLQKSNLLVVSLKEISKKKGGILAIIGFHRKVKGRDLAIFSRQLATLFDARVPVVKILKTLIAEAPNAVFQDVLMEILDDVSGGASLSLAMSKHPRVFSYFYASMVKAGEEAGKLQEVFNYLADYLERSDDISGKVKGAMIYPAAIFTVFIAVMVVMLVFVIPKLTDILISSNVPIPIYTQIVISTSDFLRDYGIYMAAALIAGAIGVIRYARTEQGKEFFDTLKIHLPIFGILFKKFYLGRLSDNLSNLIGAGVPIIRALQVTATVIDNKVYENIVLDAVNAVKSGNTVGYSFEQYKEIPPLVTQMIRIGEETGKLGFILNAITRFYTREVDSMVSNLVSLIEPIMIVILGVGVAMLVGAVLVPLYNMANVIQ